MNDFVMNWVKNWIQFSENRKYKVRKTMTSRKRYAHEMTPEELDKWFAHSMRILREPGWRNNGM